MLTEVRYQIFSSTLLAAVWLAGPLPIVAKESDSPESNQAAEILKSTAVTGGLIVHLGCGDGKLTAALRDNDRLQVHGLDRDPANVDRARERIQKLGLYGKVAIDQLRGNRLPYIDNLVNLVVAGELGEIPMAEVTRVLAPQGVAHVQQSDGSWKSTIKPRRKDIDDWTHFMHDASGNAVAHDTVVGPPRHLQWIGSPRWSRHHDRMASLSALVSSAGRIFYIMDEGSRISIQLPPKWTLIARDAFNGTVLWKQPIAKWHHHLWPLKSGPTQLARRLVATPDRVYVTLSINGPLTALDAATGEVIHKFADSEATEEVIVDGQVVYLVANKGASPLREYRPQLNVGDQGRVGREFRWNEQARQVMAYNANSGQLLWKKETRIAPLTLASADGRVYFHDGTKVVCVDAASGSETWTSEPAARRASFTFNFGPKVVLHDGVVLFAGGDRKMRGLDAKTGKQLWSAPHARGGYASPEDLLVVNGLVWSAPTTGSRDSGVWTGRDFRTGEVKVEFPPNVSTYWFHHRCYMAKATDRFLLPSRTGIEFVDYQKKDWDINHWVRGGCLYGIMPCNGMVYAPPHNCACYPEAKLYGLNALVPADNSSITKAVRAAGAGQSDRLEKGPAFGKKLDFGRDFAKDWPTYRGNSARSGFTRQKVAEQLKQSWQTELGGKLSAITVADGKLFVAQIDQHTVHCLDAASGKPVWSFTAGGRVDSPPTYFEGSVLFGSADGYVYSVDSEQGDLIWQFRAAPVDLRLGAMEQLESVWPVHGNVLVTTQADNKDPVASFVAGRSYFLDGGLRLIRLDARTGQLLAEKVLDQNDPASGENLQKHVKVLQMPVGLPDVLSSDGKYTYMRSQAFDAAGKRVHLEPHSSDFAGQGSVQRGPTAHLFSPTGFLDDTYFHRSYWVYGRSFSGGHAGYFQAGKYAPSGRILVHDDENVYGFGRKPQYLRWTTTIEHQLFAASRQPPPEAREEGTATVARSGRRSAGGSMIRFAITKSLDPTKKPLAVEAWIKAEKPSGTILARGGPAQGYALIVDKGKPKFVVRANEKVAAVTGEQRVVGRWVHVAGVLNEDRKLQLYVDGKLVASGEAPSLIGSDPKQALEIGADDMTAVGEYKSPFMFTGLIDEVRVYHGPVTAREIQARYKRSADAAPEKATVVLSCSFDKRNAKDDSATGNHGTLAGAKPAEGKFGGAMRFVAKAKPSRAAGSFVKHQWDKDIPLLARAMLLADKTLFVAGPPDLIDEEESFQRLTARDPEVQKQLAEQAAALEGKQGALLLAVSATDGNKLAQYKLDALPVWDGLAATSGHLFLATRDGKVTCYSD